MAKLYFKLSLNFQWSYYLVFNSLIHFGNQIIWKLLKWYTLIRYHFNMIISSFLYYSNIYISFLQSLFHIVQYLKLVFYQKTIIVSYLKVNLILYQLISYLLHIFIFIANIHYIYYLHSLKLFNKHTKLLLTMHNNKKDI